MGGELRKVLEYTSKQKRIAVSFISIKPRCSVSAMYIYCPLIHQVNFRIINWILHSCGKNHVTACLCALLLALKQTNKFMSSCHHIIISFINYNIPVTVICCHYSVEKKCYKFMPRKLTSTPLKLWNIEGTKSPIITLNAIRLPIKRPIILGNKSHIFCQN